MRTVINAIAKAVDLRDAIGLSGFGLLSYGVWSFNHSAGFIVAGALMIAFAISLSRK